jgi:hypothetical protein
MKTNSHQENIIAASQKLAAYFAPKSIRSLSDTYIYRLLLCQLSHLIQPGLNPDSIVKTKFGKWFLALGQEYTDYDGIVWILASLDTAVNPSGGDHPLNDIFQFFQRISYEKRHSPELSQFTHLLVRGLDDARKSGKNEMFENFVLLNRTIAFEEFKTHCQHRGIPLNRPDIPPAFHPFLTTVQSRSLLIAE